VLAKGPKSPLFNQYKEEVKFFMSHVYRRSYFLHFRKCFSNDCEHCKNNIKYPEALKLLKNAGDNFSLLKPVLIKELYNGSHYPSFIDILKSESLLGKMREQISTENKQEQIERCSRCYWFYQSNNDKRKHLWFCK